MPDFTAGSPLVYLTIHTGNSAVGSYSTTFADAVAHVYNITSKSFDVRLFMKETISGSQKIYINWMAIGPKNK